MGLEWTDGTTLPTEQGDYIVCLAFNEVTVCHRDFNYGWFCPSISESFDDEDILFWMPLPPAPTEDE